MDSEMGSKCIYQLCDIFQMDLYCDIKKCDQILHRYIYNKITNTQYTYE